MNLALDGKRALVTGSSAGIGAAIAQTLADEGATVVVHGLGEKETDAVAADIRGRGGHAIAVFGDITDDGAVDAACDEIDATVGGVDILINNAGAYPMQDWWTAQPATGWPATTLTSSPASASSNVSCRP